MKLILLSSLTAFLTAFVAPQACAQTFDKDYQELDSVTKKFSTYVVLIKTPYLTLSKPQLNRLPAYFKFLRKKKEVSEFKHPDFVITILIENIEYTETPAIMEVAQPQNVVGHTGRRFVQIIAKYKSSLALNVTTSSGYVYNIPLASGKLFTKKYNTEIYGEVNKLPRLSERDINPVEDKYAKHLRLPTDFLIEDFYDTLRGYKKGKRL
jgi:hypothetical protein